MCTDQGLRRLQLPRLEQGKPERQVVFALKTSDGIVSLDLTYAVTRSVKNAKNLHDCVSPLTYTNTSDALAVAAA